MNPFKCPICKNEVGKKDNSFFPFFSERCKLIDLGAWLDGKYVIEEQPPGDEEKK